jgi:hypothetical protein
MRPIPGAEVGVNWGVTSGERRGERWVLGNVYSLPRKTHFLKFFLPLHYPNNYLENISMFYLAPLQLSSQKTILRLKKILVYLPALHPFPPRA